MNISVLPPRKQALPEATYLDSARVVRDIRADEGFEQDREQHGLALALGKTAGRLAELSQQNPDDKDHQLLHAYTVISKLPMFVTGNDSLKAHQETKSLTREQVREAKIGLVEFNHAIKHLLNDDPTLQLSEVATFLQSIHQASAEESAIPGEGTSVESSEFRLKAEASLRGMQHEIFARNIIDSLAPEFTADDDVSIDDDLKGADLFVTYQGVKFPIDIKSSPVSMRRSRAKSSNPKHILWSGINSRDVYDRFRLTTAEIDATKDYMRSALLKAHAEYLGRARRFGTQVLQQERPVPSPAKPIERITSNEVGTESLQPILVAHFNEIRDYQAETASAEQQKQMLELLRREVYPVFSEYFDQAGYQTVIETREKICKKFAEGDKSRREALPALRRFIEKMIREYQVREYADKYPKRVSLAASPDTDGYDIAKNGKKHYIQGGLRSVVDPHLTSAGYFFPITSELSHKKTRIFAA